MKSSPALTLQLWERSLALDFRMYWLHQTPQKHLEYVTCLKQKLDNYETEYITFVKDRVILPRDYSKIIT
jgi:hypothetical protein